MKLIKTILIPICIGIVVNLTAQNLRPFQQGDKWGYKTVDGVEKVPALFSAVGEFEGGYAWINTGADVKFKGNPIGGKWGLVDKAGSLVIPVEYDYIDYIAEDMVAVNVGGVLSNEHVIGGQWGFYNLKERRMTVAPVYSYVNPFNVDGIAWVLQAGKIQRKIRAVKVFSDDKKKSVEQVNRLLYTDGFMGIWSVLTQPGTLCKWSLINKNGEVLTKTEYDIVFDFVNGFACVGKGGKYGFVDNTGYEVIPCIYEAPTYMTKDGVAWVTKTDGSSGKEYALVDMLGTELTGFKYNKVLDFNGSVAWAKCGDKWMLVNSNGEELTPAKYDSTGVFNYGVAWVMVGGNYGYINDKGKEITSIVYSGVQEQFGQSMFVKFEGGKTNKVIGWAKVAGMGLIWFDTEGNVVVPLGIAKEAYNVKDDVIPDELWDY